LRYLEADLARLHVSKRPLVVSFKRIPPRNHPTSYADDFTLSSCNYCNALHTGDHHQQHPRMTYHQRMPLSGHPTDEQNKNDEPSSPYEKYHMRKTNNNNKTRLPKIFGYNPNLNKLPKSSSPALNENCCQNDPAQHKNKHEFEKPKHLLSQMLETKPNMYYCKHKQITESRRNISNNNNTLLLKSISHSHNKTDKDVHNDFCSFYDTSLSQYNVVDDVNNGKDILFSNLGDKNIIQKSNIVIPYCNLKMLSANQQNMFENQPSLAGKCKNNYTTNNNTDLEKINLNVFATNIARINDEKCVTLNDESFERKTLEFESFFRTKPLEKFVLIEKTFSGKLNQTKEESLQKSKSLPCF
jgi:hypothetical protein